MKKSAFFWVACFSFLLLICPGWAVSSTSTPTDLKTVSSALSSLSIPFVENTGQIHDNVAFYAKTLGGTLFVTKNGEMVYGFPGFSFVERVAGLVGAPTGITSSRTQVSSFIGNNPSTWQKTLSTYTVVSLGEIPRGISISLNAHRGKIEKIITVSPHVDPSVAISVGGATSLGLSDMGEMVVHTKKGDLVYSKPFAYQEINGKRSSVSVAYMLHNSSLTYSFSLGPYNPSHALTIDPILQSTFLGGSGDEIVGSIFVGVQGLYVTGYTQAPNFPGTTGGAQAAPGGETDAFVALLSPDLTTLVRATYLGGSSTDTATALGVSLAGIYVAGMTQSSNFPGTAGSAQPVYGGGQDAFVALLSPDLTTLVRATYLGGNYSEAATALLSLGTAGVYLAGWTSSNLPGTTGGAQASPGGGQDGFVALLSPDLTTLVQSSYLGGTGHDSLRTVTKGPAGVYVAGQTYSADFPGTTGGAQPIFGGTEDAFVSLLTPNLTTLVRSTYVGGSSTDYGYAAAPGPATGVYVAGETYSNDFPGTTEGAQPDHGGNADAFISLLSSDLTTLTRSTYLGGSGGDGAATLGVFPDDLFVAGYTSSSDLPGATGGAQSVFGGGTDGFVGRLSLDLTTLSRSTYLGGSNLDRSVAVAAGWPLGVYVAGHTFSTDFPGTVGGAQPAKGTGTDAFVSLLSWDLGRGPFPTEGTIGTVITIDGSNFGDKKGKVLIGEVAVKIVKDGWTDSSITCEIKKPMATGQHDIVVQPREPRGAVPIPYEKAFTMMAPEIIAVNPVLGSPGDPIEISGNYFGSKKGKVYVEYEDPVSGRIKKKKCKVAYWDMDPASGESLLYFIVPKPKGYIPGNSNTYSLKLTNKVGTEEIMFTID